MRFCPNCSNLHADALGFCPEDGSHLGLADPLLGTTLCGQFILKERIGQGSSGDVYRAHQLGVERPVAVKLLHANAALDSEFAIRFAREARAAARLCHANIATVYQLGQSEDGTPFIAMEWADAVPIGRGPVPLCHDEILQAGEQIASALCAAHEAGIVHRDLKPDNVLIGRRGGALHVTLVDFGIAKIFNSELLQCGETHLTRHGVVYGTPQYLSPEQAGDQDLDARADLYSFGVMLYELFAGQLPFASQGMALLVDHLSSKPKPLTLCAPNLHPRVASLVMRLLAKAPSERPASARVVLEELTYLRTCLRGANRSAIGHLAKQPQRRIAARIGLRATQGLVVASLLWLAGSGSADVESASAAASPVAMNCVPASNANETSANGETHLDQDEPSPASHAVQHAVPQRALLVSSDGYALRVLMPEYLGANTEHALAVEVWDSAGRPVRNDALVLVFTDVDGQERGVSVPAGAVAGRYEVDRSFAREGTHAVQVLPDRQEVSLRVHFDVTPEGAPNT